MSVSTTDSNVTAPTQLLRGTHETYAYRRLGGGTQRPLLCLQHFTGTLDNWDPAVTDPLASDSEVILFDSAGVGRSTGKVPLTVAEMAVHALDFLDALRVTRCDVLGFSLGGMVAQQMVLERPSIIQRMILVGTAPRGGEDIMHLEKPSLAKPLGDSSLKGYAVLQKVFFAPTVASQAAGGAFVARLVRRKEDLDTPSGPNVAAAQIAAFRDWEQASAAPFRARACAGPSRRPLGGRQIHAVWSLLFHSRLVEPHVDRRMHLDTRSHLTCVACRAKHTTGSWMTLIPLYDRERRFPKGVCKSCAPESVSGWRCTHTI